MPELPEVETVTRYIAKRVLGKTLLSAHTPSSYQRALHNIKAKQLTTIIKRNKIINVFRRGKFIVLEIGQGYICIHLRMTGRLLTTKVSKSTKKYITAWFKFTDGCTLSFMDTRKFGRIYFYRNLDILNSKLGVEPLSSKFTSRTCFELLTCHKRQLKPLLLDQSIITGIGNIYADEILWAAKLHPQMLSSKLSLLQCRNICMATKRILTKSIKLNGTTFQSFYFGNEKTGSFINSLKVFDRTGETCPRCKTTIIKTRVAQRGTHICPKCQRL